MADKEKDSSKQERKCTRCAKTLLIALFYSKGPGRWSSSCRACELATKKERWLKIKRKKSRTRSNNKIELSACQISFNGSPDWEMVEECLKDLLNGANETS